MRKIDNLKSRLKEKYRVWRGRLSRLAITQKQVETGCWREWQRLLK